MAIANATQAEVSRVVNALNMTTPSSTTPAYVSLRGYNHATIIIKAKNAAGAVTGSAISLKQATAVAGTGEKSLTVNNIYQNLDTAAGDTLTRTAISNGTFTTDTTSSKLLMYVVSVKAEKLDVSNNFDCFRVATGDAVNTTLDITYVLYEPRYAENIAIPDPILD